MLQMRHRAYALVSVLSLLSWTPAAAQTAQPPADALQRAGVLFAQSDWKGALEAYTALAKEYPAHALSKFRIGVALVGLGRYAEGEASLREGERMGVPAMQAGLRLAQALAGQHRDDAAIAELKRSARAGMVVPLNMLENDPEISKLKGHAEWKPALDAFDANLRPCMHDPRFREFDFWVGDWDVRPVAAKGAGPASRNNITLEEDGCVVMEHWTGAGSGTGTSYNIFDRSYGLWRQSWVDNSGGMHDYRGKLKDGNMVLEGDTPAPNGALGRIPTRLTLFHISKDTVRQLSQFSSDSGRTWQLSYDFLYVRRGKIDK